MKSLMSVNTRFLGFNCHRLLYWTLRLTQLIYKLTLKRCSQLWLWCDCDCDDRATSCNIVRFRVHNCDWDCDATAMWLRPEINMFIFLRGCTRLQPIAMQESAWAWSTSCGVIVYCYFHVFRLINKDNLFFAVIFLFNYVHFIRCETWIMHAINVSK